MGKRWTKDDLEYLQENIGNKSYKLIAKHLGRTLDALKVKANRLGLFGLSDDYVKAPELARILGVNANKIQRWIRKYGLPAIFITTTSKAKFWHIIMDQLWGWLEVNQFRWSAKTMELNA
jgi:hypothetical protein